MCRVLHRDLDNNVFICGGIRYIIQTTELAVNARQNVEILAILEDR